MMMLLGGSWWCLLVEYLMVYFLVLGIKILKAKNEPQDEMVKDQNNNTNEYDKTQKNKIDILNDIRYQEDIIPRYYPIRIPDDSILIIPMKLPIHNQQESQ